MLAPIEKNLQCGDADAQCDKAEPVELGKGVEKVKKHITVQSNEKKGTLGCVRMPHRRKRTFPWQHHERGELAERLKRGVPPALLGEAIGRRRAPRRDNAGTVWSEINHHRAPCSIA